MSKHRFAVIGLGEFGEALALELTRLGCDVLAVDRSPHAAGALRDRVARVAIADVSNKAAMTELFNTRFDAVVVAMGTSLEASLLAVLHLQELKLPRIVVEVSTPEGQELMTRIGVKEIFSPERDSGVRMAHRILNPDVLGFLPLEGDLSVVKIEAPAWMHGKTLGDLELRRRRLAIIVRHHNDGKVSIVPPPDEKIAPGDRLTIVGLTKVLDELDEE